MAGWLMKTEPDDYSWDQLVKDGETVWTGVRNYQAAKNIRAMQDGDPVFFYRSVVQPAVVGIMKVAGVAYADPADERWAVIKLRPDRKLPHDVTLAAIKADPRFAEMTLVRNSRLSVQPVTDDHWRLLCELGGL